MSDLNPKQFWKYPQRQTEQMKMFMSAREIKNTYAPWSGDREEIEDWMDGDDIDSAPSLRQETDEEVWTRKADEAAESDLYEDVVEHGVRKPVHLEVRDPNEPRGPREDPREHVLGGHHRIASMGDVRPDDLMPVLHHTDIFEAMGGIGFDPSKQVGRHYPYS